MATYPSRNSPTDSAEEADSFAEDIPTDIDLLYDRIAELRHRHAREPTNAKRIEEILALYLERLEVAAQQRADEYRRRFLAALKLPIGRAQHLKEEAVRLLNDTEADSIE